MIRSIRVRLTLAYVSILSVILILSGFVVYSRLAASRYEQLDSRLDLACRVIAASLAHEIEEHSGQEQGEASFRSVLLTVHKLTFPRQAVTVIQGPRTVGLTRDADSHQVPMNALVRAAGLSSDTGAAVGWSDSGWRFSALRITVPKAGAYVFVSGAPETDTMREVVALRQSFLLGVPVAILLSAMGGYWLAKRSLAPVVVIAETVETITSRSLDRRVPVVNPGDELGFLAQTFNRLLERLQDAFEQKRRFMADASHELRTPISIAHTATEVTLEQPHRTEDEYREALLIVDGQLQRLKRLVEDMFLLARADSGAVPLRKSKFYLDELLAETARAARVLGSRKGVSVELAPMKEALCEADESLIRQMVMVLLDNAVKYSSAGGRVAIQLTQDVSHYQIFVKDSGPGIPAGAQARIFDRFYRVDPARSRSMVTAGGAGLGLSIARWVAEAHKGTLTLVESNESGSVFCATFPSGECV